MIWDPRDLGACHARIDPAQMVPRTDFGCQIWSYLQKLVLAVPNLSTNIGPGDHFLLSSIGPRL